MVAAGLPSLRHRPEMEEESGYFPGEVGEVLRPGDRLSPLHIALAEHPLQRRHQAGGEQGVVDGDRMRAIELEGELGPIGPSDALEDLPHSGLDGVLHRSLEAPDGSLQLHFGGYDVAAIPAPDDPDSDDAGRERRQIAGT